MQDIPKPRVCASGTTWTGYKRTAREETTCCRAIFLDRDGVINVNRPDYVKCWDEFAFLPRTLNALRRIAATDFRVIVATNQAAIHRHIVEEATVRDIHARMTTAIERAGGCVHAIYYCPHRPDENCDCRKPKPGMFRAAALDFGIDLTRSYVIGDARMDIEAACAIGAQPILVLSGRGCDQRVLDNCASCVENCVVVEDLLAAVEWIERQEATAQS